MKPEFQKLKPLLSECRYQFARSGGKGGQNVNKLNTKAELYFNVAKSFLLDDDQKNLLHRRLQNKLNKEGELIIVSQKFRTQQENKKDTQEKFLSAIHNALQQIKKRVATKATTGSKEKRMSSKKILSDKKQLRRTVKPGEE